MANYTIKDPTTSMSDADLMARIKQLESGPQGPPTQTPDVQSMSDADLLGRIKSLSQTAPQAQQNTLYKVPSPSDAPQPKAPPVTLDQRAQQVFGIDPTLKRGSILPVAENKQGKLEFALPQFAVDMAKSFLLPGHAMQGGSYTMPDVTKMALDYNPSIRSPATAMAPTKTQFIRSTPPKDVLRNQSTALYRQADARGIMVHPDYVANKLGDLENEINKFGISKTLHPTATGVLNEWTKRIGKNLSLRDLEIMRREADTVAKLPKDEGVIGSKMKEAVDSLINGMTEKDVTAGNPEGIGGILKRARAIWQRQAKMDQIDEIFTKAETQASGFENGVRIGFRQILQNKAKRRGFTPDELAAMKTVVNGGPVQAALRLFGHFGPGTQGSNRALGSAMGISLGAAGGSHFGGPEGAAIGSMMVPAAAHMAGRAAARNTATNAEFVRALAARGGLNPTLNPLAARLGQGFLGPALGTQIGPNGGLIVNGKEVF